MATLKFCGAAGTVTGSCSHIITDKAQFMIDCGLFQGNKTTQKLNYEPFPFDPKRVEFLILTHAHIDHILGCAWIHKQYGLLPEMHKADIPTLKSGGRTSSMYGISYNVSPDPEKFLAAGDTVKLGDDELQVLFVPGHAPGHIALYSKAQQFVICGDVLFMNSIGRTDLPGGDTETLLRSIREQLFPLGDAVKVYCGHGPDTTIGQERKSNPFVR